MMDLDLDLDSAILASSPNHPDMHVHEMRNSRDCDGAYEGEITFSEFAGLSGREAWSAYVAHMIKFADLYSEVERYTDEDGFWHLEYGGPTDEGFEWTHAHTCTSPGCTLGRNSFRDYTAESMGY